MGPTTQFVRVDESDVAYQVIGGGDIDLLLMAGSATNVDIWWDYPEAARLWTDLANAGRLVLFDRRGAGASERISVEHLPGWQDWADDADAVLECVGSKSAYVIAVLDAGPAALLLAIRRPEVIRGLILIRSGARIVRDIGYDYGHTSEAFDTWCDRFRENWGTAEWVKTVYPGAVDPRFIEWSMKYQRASYSGRVGAEFMRQWAKVDARGLLSKIRVPTLVIGRQEEFVGIEHSLYLAENIPGAQLLELQGRGGILEMVGELQRPILDFIGGKLETADRYILFTDIVGSTEHARERGDESWSALLDQHDLITRVAVGDHSGRIIKSTGDGVLATFDRADSAVEAAAAAIERLRNVDLDIRAGIHSGAVVQRGSDIGGLTVHMTARIMSLAGPGEILISDAVASTTHERFHLSAPTEVEVKGFSEKVVVRRVLAGPFATEAT